VSLLTKFDSTSLCYLGEICPCYSDKFDSVQDVRRKPGRACDEKISSTHP